MARAAGTVFVEVDGLLYVQPGAPPRVIPAASLSEVCVGWFPPTVRTRAGTYHPVPAIKVVELAELAHGSGVPFLHRDDVWGWLLAPFLDTELNEGQDARLLELLDGAGLSRAEVAALRARVEGPMLAYTAITWEWQAYGLWDVLAVMGEGFRAEAFAIADRGQTRPSSREALLRLFPDARGPR